MNDWDAVGKGNLLLKGSAHHFSLTFRKENAVISAPIKVLFYSKLVKGRIERPGKSRSTGNARLMLFEHKISK